MSNAATTFSPRDLAFDNGYVKTRNCSIAKLKRIVERLSVMRQTGRIPIYLEVHVLVILTGGRRLIVRHPSIPVS
jgi:hypothetical protein